MRSLGDRILYKLHLYNKNNLVCKKHRPLREVGFPQHLKMVDEGGFSLSNLFLRMHKVDTYMSTLCVVHIYTNNSFISIIGVDCQGDISFQGISQLGNPQVFKNKE